MAEKEDKQNNNEVVVEIDYTNYENKRAVRNIVVSGRGLFFGLSEAHGAQKQWFVEAQALDRNRDLRTFAVKDIHNWTELDRATQDSAVELDSDEVYVPTGGWKHDEVGLFHIEVQRQSDKRNLWLEMSGIADWGTHVCWLEELLPK